MSQELAHKNPHQVAEHFRLMRGSEGEPHVELCFSKTFTAGEICEIDEAAALAMYVWLGSTLSWIRHVKFSRRRGQP